jgi:hypothetical protein
MDINSLLHALNNDNNETILELSFAKIAKEKNDILQQLNIPRNELTRLNKQLKAYRLINDIQKNNINDLRYGSYIRWISLKNPEIIKLTNGGIVCDIKVINDDIIVKCKNKNNLMFQVKLSEVILFQKLSEQEQIILKALKYLQE